MVNERRRENGSVMIFVVIALGALIALAAWSTETSRIWRVKSQLQAIADTAALAARMARVTSLMVS